MPLEVQGEFGGTPIRSSGLQPLRQRNSIVELHRGTDPRLAFPVNLTGTR